LPLPEFKTPLAQSQNFI